jgi:hypothetical protein
MRSGPEVKQQGLKLYLHSIIQCLCCYKSNVFLKLRMRTIENSNPNLPISLLLIKNTQQNKDEVVGHAKISRLPLVPGTCLIESGINIACNCLANNNLN